MLKIYGSMLCKDCIACREALDREEIGYAFLDFADQLQNLKGFLRIRDENPLFTGIKAEGKIGIPCIVAEDGRIVTDWETLL